MIAAWFKQRDWRAMKNGLCFRTVGRTGDPYPEWIKALRHECGVYVIRDVETKCVLYVGESHSFCLYKTLIRHLQQWRDRTGHYGGNHVWHICYRRDEVEVAILRRGRTRVITVQNELIRDLKPRDNRDVPDDDPVPF